MLDGGEVACSFLLLYQLSENGTILWDAWQWFRLHKLSLDILDEVLLLQFENLTSLLHHGSWVLALLDLEVERHLIGATNKSIRRGWSLQSLRVGALRTNIFKRLFVLHRQLRVHTCQNKLHLKVIS